jgi:hypothetical protein
MGILFVHGTWYVLRATLLFFGGDALASPFFGFSVTHYSSLTTHSKVAEAKATVPA